MHVGILLKDSAHPVHTIPSNQTVDDAINLMTSKKVSALVVTENDRPVGIFAERDILRSYLKNRNALFTKIQLTDVMSGNLITARPDDNISDTLATMIQADIKHLPVVEGETITALIVLNDLIKYQIDTLTAELHQLKDYITDLHEAGRD